MQVFITILMTRVDRAPSILPLLSTASAGATETKREALFRTRRDCRPPGQQISFKKNKCHKQLVMTQHLKLFNCKANFVNLEVFAFCVDNVVALCVVACPEN